MKGESKYRMLYLYQYLMRHTDQDHMMTTNQLIQMLKDEYDIEVNRNTIVKDLDIMNRTGLRVEVKRSTQNRYYYDGGTFDIPELKVLLDAVASSKFITEKKSQELTGKLLNLTSEHGAVKLRRNLQAEGRVRSDNEKGYYIVDAINEAINLGVKITFQYTEYSPKKQRMLTHDGEWYVVSPYALIWDGDYYYCVAYSEKRDKIQNFRLDRIAEQPEILKDKPAKPKPKRLKLADYSKSVFRMYDTDEAVDVELLCENHLMKWVIDQFGPKVKTRVMDSEHFRVKAKVYASPTFYRWVFGWGGAMQITKPQKVVDAYRAMLEKAIDVHRSMPEKAAGRLPGAAGEGD